MCTDKTNVEYVMYDYTGNNWSHRNSNKRFKGKVGSHNKRTFNRFSTKDSCTWNVKHIIRKVLKFDTRSQSGGDSRWFKRRSARDKRLVKRQPNTVERRLSEPTGTSDSSDNRTHTFFILRSNNEKSAITSRNKVLCHFY